jgi:hypothetical protein
MVKTMVIRKPEKFSLVKKNSSKGIIHITACSLNLMKLHDGNKSIRPLNHEFFGHTLFDTLALETK